MSAKGDLRYLWERPTVREAPAFHLQLDQPRQTIDRLSRVLRVRQRSASCHCSSWTRAIIRIPNHPMNQRRYPACTDTHVCIYIYICKIDARIVRTLTLLHRAFATIAWWQSCGHVGWSVRLCKSFLYLSTMAIIPLGPIHGLGIREIRTQLANCRPRIRRWNSIERNAITVFLPGREGMEASGEPISEILVHVSIHDALPRNICHSAMNFSTSRIKS